MKIAKARHGGRLRSSQSPVGATKKSPSHGDAGDGAPNGPVGLLICEVTRRGGLSDKDPAGLGRVVMATEQKEITTSPWSSGIGRRSHFLLESRQPDPIRLKRLQLIHGGTRVQERAL